MAIKDVVTRGFIPAGGGIGKVITRGFGHGAVAIVAAVAGYYPLRRHRRRKR